MNITEEIKLCKAHIDFYNKYLHFWAIAQVQINLYTDLLIRLQWKLSSQSELKKL